MEAAKLVLGLNFLLIFQLNLVVFAADGYSRNDFPPGFVFGASTSAYQYEGAANGDGRTPSIWDTFAHAGYMNGTNGEIACDGYHKYKEDVQLMVDTGLDAYRFSISWSRLIPNGRGPVNLKGLQYYNNLINELIRNGIQPHVTLHHADLPQALEDEYGGWVNRKIVRDFTAYADVCFREFGDRVLHWTTLNEANVFVLGGYDLGFLPPQRCSASLPFNCSKGNSSTEPYMAAHNMLLAHAAVAKLYKENYQVLHPLVYGDYPSSMKEIAGSRMPAFTNFESKQIKDSFDFIGLNFYLTMSVKDQPSSLQIEHRDVMADMGLELMPLQYNASTFEFPIVPWGLKRLLEYFKEAFENPPIYIHENGQRMRRNSSLEDWPRIKYLNAYIGSVLDAVRNGSDTRGYFAWSFIDMFELVGGYEPSYGLYYVDLDDPDLTRYPKLSAHWYSEFFKGKSMDLIQLKDKSLLNPEFTH